MESNNKALKSLSPNKIIWPVIIGLGIFLYLTFSQNLDYQKILDNIKGAHLGWIALAIIVLLFRDLGYMQRIRYITEKKLNWWSSFYVIMLWEFASAITPSVVGGTAVAVFILNREKIKFGRALAYVMVTAAFDNLFFVFASLGVVLFFPHEIFPPETNQFELLGIPFTLQALFITSVSLIAFYSFLMSYGLIFQARGFKRFLIRLTSLPLLKRFRRKAIDSGNEMIIASAILKEKPKRFWVNTAISTILIWSARYLMLNCIIAAFSPLDLGLIDHFLIFSRQIIMWIVMLISPTPGSAGTAEYFFDLFFKEFFNIAGLSLIVALFWRLFTYYAYLVIGFFVLPRWLKKVLSQENNKNQ